MQQTIYAPVEFKGTALHSGEEVHIRCLPAGVNRGVVFRRVDLEGRPEIEARPSNVVSTRRCTGLGLKENEEVTVHTVEHMMAAIWAMGIDNIIIEVDNTEMPVGDGSALPYIELFEKADIRGLNKARTVNTVNRPFYMKKRDMYLVILPDQHLKISYTLDFAHPVVGTQYFEYDNSNDSFREEIAPARTFGFEREVEALHKRGLALGGSLDNAVLIGEDATVNQLRFEDEFVRHKILDVIGDMALNGFINGHIIAVKSGHYLHVELARKLSEHFQDRRKIYK